MRKDIEIDSERRFLMALHPGMKKYKHNNRYTLLEIVSCGEAGLLITISQASIDYFNKTVHYWLSPRFGWISPTVQHTQKCFGKME